MKTSLVFEDRGTDVFLKLATISNGLVKEALSVEASKISEAYKDAFEQEQPSEWSSYNAKHERFTRNNKRSKRNAKDATSTTIAERRLTLLEKKAKFGAKHSMKTGESIGTQNLKDHIKFYTTPNVNELYAVIGGGHPTFRPVQWKDGIAVGYLGSQKATTKATLEYLDGINDGKTIVVTDKMRKFLNTTAGLQSGGIKKSTKRLVVKPRHFAEAGRTKGIANAIPSIIDRYNKNFPNAIANITVKQVIKETA